MARRPSRVPWPVRWLRGACLTVAAVLAAATTLAFAPVDTWWIRVLDFPRQQIAAGLAACLVMLLVVYRGAGRGTVAVALAASAALAVQLAWIAPYTSVVDAAMRATGECDAARRLRLLAVNVRYENDNSAALRRIIRETDPDVVLVTEPGRWWESELAPIERDLPHVIRQSQEDTWGMLMYSRFPLVEPEVRFLVEPDIPSIRTRLVLPSGDQVWLYGVHPRPPAPGADTDARDAELRMVGREIRALRQPTVLTGDLNDVAWSQTTARLLEIGDLLDPRIGRGPFSTFDATKPAWFRWPLDYVFYTDDFSLCGMQLLDDIGSDHVPLLAEAVLHRDGP